MTDLQNQKTPEAFFLKLFKLKTPLLIAFAFLLTLLAISSTGIRLKEDIMDLLPLDDPVINKHHTIIKGFNRMDLTFFDIGPLNDKAKVSPDDMIKTGDRLVEKLNGEGLFSEIFYRWDESDLMETLELLGKHRSSLFTAEDEIKLEEKLEPQRIRKNLINWRRILTESPTPAISRSFYNDPLSMDSLILSKIAALRTSGTAVKMEQGRVFSSDLKHLLILAKPKFPGTDSVHAKKLVASIEQAIHEITHSPRNKGIRIAYLGSHRFSLDNSTMIKGDIERTLTISLIAIIILSLLVYRRPLLSIITVLPAFFGAFFASGILRIISPEISAISIGCGAMLAGIAVDYGIHILFHIDRSLEAEHDHNEIAATLGRLIRPLFLGATTTIGAFLCLQASLMPGLRQLGLFAAFGIGGAFLFSILALPLIIPKGAAKKGREPVIKVSNIFPPYFKWVEKNRAIIIIIVSGLTLISLYGLKGLGFEGDIQKLNAASKETKKDWKEIIKNFGSTMSSTSVAVKSSSTEEALNLNDKLFDELLKLREEGLIASIQSASELIPGSEKQQMNIKRWNTFWHEERLAKVADDLKKAALEVRMRTQILMRALAGLPGVSPSLAVEELNKGFLKNILSSNLSITEEETFILTNLKLTDYKNYSQVARSIESSVPQAIITNSRHFAQHMINLIYNELERLGGLALIIVTFIIIAWRRKRGNTPALILPLLLSLFWTFGIMGLTGIKLNIMNAIIVIFIFGLVIDYAIFLQAAWRNSDAGEANHLSITCGAITISATTTLCGLGSLLFADHPALHAIGLTAFLGICCGLAAVMLLIPLSGKRDL
ncbi:MAG: MMPL family transporter [Deltaproteobacteria bacterium]|nr:MMPL family transporter [Deltaproteobacteria bacterium]